MRLVLIGLGGLLNGAGFTRYGLWAARGDRRRVVAVLVGGIGSALMIAAAGQS